ncbi:MAG: pyridoxamine 5'-phosphate oxidase family protein [Gammaproteobacteria bacterium]|nr:pyridoxamine 5'-phosphate oxidase family protein [Gammaproteobacteria bacterium]
MNKDIKSFITERIIGIISTTNGQTLHGVPVYYHYVDYENAFYFLTKTVSKKYSNLEKNNKASFTIFNEDPPKIFTADCEAELLNINEDNCSDKFIKLVEIHSSQQGYPTPVSTMTEGLLALVKLNVNDFDYKSYIQDINLLKSS